MRLRVSDLEDIQVRLASAERALRDSEERFRFLYENAPLGYQCLDEEGRILEVNPSWLETLEYSREEVIGRWFVDFLAPRYIEKFREKYANFKATGEIHEIEIDMLRKDGSTIPVALDGHITRDSCGRFKQTQCILRDLTQDKGSRQELEESQERLSLALDGANLGIWDWDLTKGKAYWTERALGMLGYEANEVEPTLKNWKKLVHPDDWPGVSENLNLHIQGKLPRFEAAYRIRDKCGNWRWTQTKGSVVELDEAGKPTRMTGVVVDITDRKKAEEALRESEQRYRTLVEDSFDGIFLQKGTTIVFANKPLHEMLGYEPGELLGKDHWIIYHPADQSMTRARAQARLRGERVIDHYEVRLQSKEGAVLDGDIRAKVFYFGEEPGIQVWVRDISDRKKAEERIMESERKYRELVEHANSIILRWTCDGRITFLNEFGQQFFGYSAEEIIGRHVVGTIVPVTDSDWSGPSSTDGSNSIEPKERSNKTSMRTCAATESGSGSHGPTESWRTSRDRWREVLSIGTDITERKQAQEALRQAHDELGASRGRAHRGIGRGQGTGRSGRSFEVRLSGHHVARTAHAAQFHHRVHRHHPARAGRAAESGADQAARNGPRQRPAPAGAHQRRARHLQDRGRATRGRERAVRPARIHHEGRGHRRSRWRKRKGWRCAHTSRPRLEEVVGDSAPCRTDAD